MTRKTRIDSESRIINAPAEEIYAAFADPAAWEEWLPPVGMTGRVGAFDFREGGRYRLTLTYADESGTGKSSATEDVVEGSFVELIPNRRMVQEVTFASDDPAFSGTMVMTWSLEQQGGGTLVTINAENVPSGIAPEDHAAGMGSTLDNLARFVTSRQDA